MLTAILHPEGRSGTEYAEMWRLSHEQSRVRLRSYLLGERNATVSARSRVAKHRRGHTCGRSPCFLLPGRKSSGATYPVSALRCLLRYAFSLFSDCLSRYPQVLIHKTRDEQRAMPPATPQLQRLPHAGRCPHREPPPQYAEHCHQAGQSNPAANRRAYQGRRALPSP